MEKMARSELKKAPYNPRTMTEDNKRKLRLALKRHGLVAPITYNKRTGNIVGGHQRVEALDTIAGTKDYELNVAVIDVDESREKELNIALNNAQAMGDWDFSKLDEMLKGGLELSGTGFDASDVFKMFGSETLSEMPTVAQEFSEAMDKMRGVYDRISSVASEPAAKDDGSEFYIVVVFPGHAACDEFISDSGLPNERYVSREVLVRAIRRMPRKDWED